MRSVARVLGSKHPPPIRPRPKPRNASSLRQNGPRILIVEDELFVAWHLEALLRDLSCTVCAIAADGDSAVTKAGKLELDLILMDVNLGGKVDGIEIAQRIREANAAPIVFVTAYGDPATRRRVEQAIPGAPVLPKPVHPHQLRDAIAEAMHAR